MQYLISKALFFFAAVALMMNLFSVEARAEKKVGILLFGQDARYVESKDGILDQLKKDGYGEPAVKYMIANAEGSKMKASKMAKELVEKKMDLIITLGTNATIAAMKETKDVPIVFTMVYDPIEAGIVNNLQSSGNNTTGVCTGGPMGRFISALKEFAPVKTMAVLYTPGEKQTEIQLKELLKLQAGSQVKVVPVPLTNKEDVTTLISQVVRTVDAIYLTGSSIVVATVSAIVDMANKSKVITITHVEELVGKGVLIGITPNSYAASLQAGKKAARILKGAKPSSVAIDRAEKYDYILNMKTAKIGQFQIRPSFMNNVTKTIE